MNELLEAKEEFLDTEITYLPKGDSDYSKNIFSSFQESFVSGHGKGESLDTEFRKGLARHAAVFIAREDISNPEYRDEILYDDKIWVVQQIQAMGPYWKVLCSTDNPQNTKLYPSRGKIFSNVYLIEFL